MLRQNSSCINWHVLLVGLLFIIVQCDARAVNVSNTWTMPQEGLNVFYRFFRDRISWFEADAVCQFHHANLVTVDNSFQFDATRDLLRELDVNDIVWIGLMRPQSSDRFMWSNSRPLVADTGYWAESLPLMDAPLCAVIDPIRDYRWHALRCGGPETASFLCEMPVPSWADACNLKDMPNLTLQYMADTASIELIRNCQEEGLLRTMCRGKQDREKALQDLVCPRERLEAQRINGITNSHFKSLQIINSIPSDNNENNNIELLPMKVNYGPHYPEELQTEKNTVQRLIEQFNVDELMQADEPSNIETISSFYKIPDLIPKPVKKAEKEVLEYPQKDKEKNIFHLEIDEMMLGDQPLQREPEMTEQLLNEEVSNEILEALPHIKKSNMHKEDGVEKMEKEAIAMKKSKHKSKEMEYKKQLMVSSTTTKEPAIRTTTSMTTSHSTTTEKLSTEENSFTTMAAVTTIKSDELTKSNEDHTHKHLHESHTESENSGTHFSTTTSSATISHPIHPQLPHSNVMTEENMHPHAKESPDNSHFIPPMLMVKSHYVPPANKHSHSEHEPHHHNQQQQHNKGNTTKEQTETATKTNNAHNRNSETTMLVVTTPKVLVLETTTLKTLDTLDKSRKNKKLIAKSRQQEEDLVVEAATTESDSNKKPITEQQTLETEQYQNPKNLHLEERQTTVTATTLQPVELAENTATVATVSDKIASTTVRNNEKYAAPEKSEYETQELKPQKTAYTGAAETTEQTTKLNAAITKSLKSSEKLNNFETTTVADNKQKAQKTTDITTAETEKIQTEQHVITTKDELKKTKNEHKEHSQTIATAEKLDTTNEITTSTIATVAQTHHYPTETITKTQSLQQVEQEKAGPKKQEDVKKDQERKETIVKTTEVLVASTATATMKPEELEEEKEKEESDIQETTTALTLATTTTTVKPITTTAPQNEVKSAETSFSSTTTTTTTTYIPLPTTRDVSSTSAPTTKAPPTTTTYSTPSTSTITTITATTEAETESTTAAPKTEKSPTQTSPTETTRNFLKVTTEMPFKPNRRRSLTKPETVSYMKKILG